MEDFEDDIQKLIHQLVHKDMGNIHINGSNITVRVFEQDEKLALRTSVYNGGNYIPKSVRTSLTQPVPFNHTQLQSYLTIDEPHYEIHLNYLGQIEKIDRIKFRELLEEFSYLAEDWRFYLDEHDRHDLVHVRAL